MAHVVSLNLRRRYLDEGQREMIAARLAYLGPGRPSAHAGQSGQLAGLPPESPQIAQSAGAELLNVSERTVRAAKSMRERGVPELIEAAERGEIAVSAAAEISRQPPEAQRETFRVGETVQAWRDRAATAPTP